MNRDKEMLKSFLKSINGNDILVTNNDDYSCVDRFLSKHQPTPTDTKATQEEAHSFLKSKGIMSIKDSRMAFQIERWLVEFATSHNSINSDLIKMNCELSGDNRRLERELKQATSHNSINSEMLECLKRIYVNLRHEKELSKSLEESYYKIKQLISTAEKGKG